MRDTLEKIALLVLAGMATVSLTVIAIMALKAGKIDPNSATLVGVIVGGLIAFSKDIVQAIRGYSMSAQLGKVTDQLAASGPVATDTVKPVTIVNTVDNPVPTTTQTEEQP